MDRETRDHIRTIRDQIVRSKVRYIGSAPSTVQNLDGYSLGELPMVNTPNRAETMRNGANIDPREF